MDPANALKKGFDAEGRNSNSASNRSIDKAFNIPFNLKYHKTKQVLEVDKTSLFSKFARGMFSNKKVML